MAQTSLPPPPTKSGSGPLIGAIVAMLLIGGGVAVWKLGGSSEETPKVETARVIPEEKKEPTLHVAPPPPPPPEETAAPLPKEPQKGPSKTGPKTTGRPSACGGSCNGTIDAGFRSVLRQKAGLAKGCYDRALRQNSALQGKMTIAVRVSPTGRVCSVGTASDSLGDAAVKSCILQKFRAGKYPKPRGGCVDAQVPLNFVSKR